MSSNHLPTIAIAGASGFIGRWFIEQYKEKYRFIAISRNKVETQPEHPNIEWRQADLYSMSSTEDALKGADIALYLVHSMLPSTRLNQSRFEDTDLLLADNFARAAQKNNLKQILFVSGILPKEENISTHLRSRYEVEQTLGSWGTPVTSIRAGIIVGPGGSSFTIIERLIKRLPILICPKWTRTETQPISLYDILEIIDFCTHNTEAYHKTLEVGGPDILSYQAMMEVAAKAIGLKRIFVAFPLFSTTISKFWVGLFTNSSNSFVIPLVESLRHRMVAKSEKNGIELPKANISYAEAAKDALENKDSFPTLPKFKRNELRSRKEKNTVRSVQRLWNPQGKDAYWVAKQYQRWLPIFFRFFINVKMDDKDNSTFHILHLKKPLLQLHFVSERSFEDRQLFYIDGGLLTQRTDHGWLEFRQVLDDKYVIAAIHDFVPTLPWYFYLLTQARMHLWVMKRFGKHLVAYEKKLMKHQPDSTPLPK